MNYDETIAYLFDQLPMFQRAGAAAYRKDLRNTRALADMCGNPEEGLKCIHVAGTNGKGSTAHGLAAVFQSCGFRTGLMTSPHYKDFRERIRIDGEMIAKDYVVDWIEKHRARFEGIEPSFFELTVIMGFDYFNSEKVDIAIIETGMGGRLDSTNIVTPELSIITPIGMDHTTFLGDNLEKIAREKAGIIKEGAPVIVAEGNDEILAIIQETAEKQNAEVLSCVRSKYPIHTDLKGDYQQSNMTTVIKAVEVMKTIGWELPDSRVIEGLDKVQELTGLVGRWQELGKSPLVIADSAHNPPGIRALLRNLEETEYRSLHIVIGMVSDKDVDAVLSMLPIGATYYYCQAKVMRAFACDLLAQEGIRMGLNGDCFGSVESAITSARNAAHPKDLILVTGSVFTVAEAV